MAIMGELEQAVMDILWSTADQFSVRDVHELPRAVIATSRTRPS